MQELVWLNRLPDNRLEGGIELVNRLYWNITWWEHEGHWYVKAGEDIILRTDSRQSAEAFLYGLSLAYAVLPDATFDHLVYLVKVLAADEDITAEERRRFERPS
ncbi:MAG TPA: hypothetical protein VGR57_14660 [Ktedonobacterales bacterium]|nr:hypothetical protein [Ktedonobacterales bacterium]